MRRPILFGAWWLAGLAPAGAAQATLLTFHGDPQDAFGYAVDGAGDMNADGHADLVVGAPSFGPDASYVRVFSGLDGAVLYTFVHDEAGWDDLGYSVAGVGDANGDGFDDVLYGQWQLDLLVPAKARLASGLDGTLLHVFSDGFAGDFASAVGAAGDVDGDGFADVIVGAPAWFPNGRAKVFSGRTGALLHTLEGSWHAGYFGSWVATAGDYDGDGHDDLIVGAPQADAPFTNSGAAQVRSGLDGTVLFELLGTGPNQFVGATVDGAFDVNADGRPDFVVSGASTVQVFSGGSGGELRTFSGTNGVGAGDVDGDGHDDLLLLHAGASRVYSGADGVELFNFPYHSALAGAGDVNGDGMADVIGGESTSGIARVYGCPAPETYCSTSPNSAGAGALMGWSGRPSIGENEFVLEVSGAVPGQLGLFFYGASEAAVPFGDGLRCVGGPLFRLNPPAAADGAGALARPLDLSRPPAADGPGAILAGSTWHFQFWYRDPAGGGAGFNLSDGLRAVFCP